MKITGSRLADGNKLFPPSITIEENGLKVKIPGFLRGNSTFLAYTDISSVSVNSKLIGYSTIHFNTMGSRVSAHGFTKSEVEQVKAAIDEGKRTGHKSTVTVVQGESSPSPQKSNSGGVFGYINKTFDDTNERVMQYEKEEKEEKLKIEGKVQEIAEINISGNADEISQQLNKLLSIASSKPDKKVKNAIIEKLDFGVMKLQNLGANAEAEFFKNKIEPLKKKNIFGF